MSQTRRASLLEAFVNVLIGFWVSVAANLVILPFYGVSPGVGVAVEIGVLFTLVSLIRSYALRRMFNFYHLKGARK
jgi:hypothetical protein